MQLLRTGDVLPAGGNGATLHFGGGTSAGPADRSPAVTLQGVGAVGSVALAVGGEFSNAMASQRG